MLQTILRVFCVLFKKYCRLFGHTPILGIHAVQPLFALKYKNNASYQKNGSDVEQYLNLKILIQLDKNYLSI